ncbi:MAG: carboxypeptidase-like regulatory domain-containing protein [Thermoanaerobaculia bacterium]
MRQTPVATARPPSIVVLLLCLASLAAGNVGWAGPYPEGEFIEIAGAVTDAEGFPVPDLTVILEASRKAFSVTRMKSTERDSTQVSTVTDETGQFNLRWRWVDYYNHFELQVGVSEGLGDNAEFLVFEQVDLSKRIRGGSPVVTHVTVTETRYLDTVRDFSASIDTEDERRIFEEMGNPDRVQRILAGDHEEVSWWYFQSGKAYRFKDGVLEQVVHFEPVEPFES